MSLSRETLLFLQLREEEREAFEARANRAPEVVWTTAMGEEIPFEELEDGHLMNCIGIVYKRFFRDDSPECVAVLAALDAERKRRGLFVTPSHEAILRLVTLPKENRDVAIDFILQLKP